MIVRTLAKRRGGPEPVPVSFVDTDPTGPIPVSQPLAQPVAEPIAQPVAQPVAQPITEPAVLARLWAPASLAPTYFGVVAVAVGFALIGVAWAEIAGLTNVALQMPYLVSAGFTGLGLVMAGLIVVNVAAKRQDGAERSRQTAALTDAVTQLRATIERLESESAGDG